MQSKAKHPFHFKLPFSLSSQVFCRALQTEKYVQYTVTLGQKLWNQNTITALINSLTRSVKSEICKELSSENFH